MIADLRSDTLAEAHWGPKATRLNRLARGVPHRIPPALCIRAEALRCDEATSQSINRWLRVERAQSVIVRSSLMSEDGERSAQAGVSLSSKLIDPDTNVITRIVREFAARQPSLGAGEGSVLIQTAVHGSHYGVTFAKGDSTHTEFGAKWAQVTSGREPDGSIIVMTNSTKVRSSQVEPHWLMEQLAQVSTEVQHIFGHDLDLEWIGAGGNVFVVQARPITGRSSG